jgi:hypothetical protein
MILHVTYRLHVRCIAGGTGYSLDHEEAQLRIDALRKWKNYTKWDFNHPFLAPKKKAILAAKMPNVLYIVSDDLGASPSTTTPTTEI